MKKYLILLAIGAIALGAAMYISYSMGFSTTMRSNPGQFKQDTAVQDAIQLVNQGKAVFRYDTFGDQAFWGDTLLLHQAIEGEQLGGVGAGVSPQTALAVGLKVDVNALPRARALGVFNNR